MSRFDRYLLSQLVALFGFFALILVSVYWVNRAVGLFDRLADILDPGGVNFVVFHRLDFGHVATLCAEGITPPPPEAVFGFRRSR